MPTDTLDQLEADPQWKSFSPKEKRQIGEQWARSQPDFGSLDPQGQQHVVNTIQSRYADQAEAGDPRLMMAGASIPGALQAVNPLNATDTAGKVVKQRLDRFLAPGTQHFLGAKRYTDFQHSAQTRASAHVTQTPKPLKPSLPAGRDLQRVGPVQGHYLPPAPAAAGFGQYTQAPVGGVLSPLMQPSSGAVPSAAAGRMGAPIMGSSYMGAAGVSPTEKPDKTRQAVNDFRMRFFNTNNYEANIPIKTAADLGIDPNDKAARARFEKMQPVAKMAIAEKAAEIRAFRERLKLVGTGRPGEHPFSGASELQGPMAVAGMVEGPEAGRQLAQAQGFGAAAHKFLYGLTDPTMAMQILAIGPSKLIAAGFSASMVKGAYDKAGAGDTGGAVFDLLMAGAPVLLHGRAREGKPTTTPERATEPAPRLREEVPSATAQTERQQGAAADEVPVSEGRQDVAGGRGRVSPRDQEAVQPPTRAREEEAKGVAPAKITAAAYKPAGAKTHVSGPLDEGHVGILRKQGIEGHDTRESRETKEFGFETSDGKFVSRQRAAQIAKASGQLTGDLRKNAQGQPILHSDNVVQAAKPGTETPISEGKAAAETRVSVAQTIAVDPATLKYRESDQNRLADVRVAFPENEYWPAVTIRESDGTRLIVDGHNRAAVTAERGHQLPVVDITRADYDRLSKAGYDDMEIAYAALIRAREYDAADGIDRQFSGASVAQRGSEAAELLTTPNPPTPPAPEGQRAERVLPRAKGKEPVQPRLMEPPARTPGFEGPATRGARAETRGLPAWVTATEEPAAPPATTAPKEAGAEAPKGVRGAAARAREKAAKEPQPPPLSEGESIVRAEDGGFVVKGPSGSEQWRAAVEPKTGETPAEEARPAQQKVAELDAQEAALWDAIKKRGGVKGRKAGAALGPEDFRDLIHIGAIKMRKGAIKFSDWSAQMIEAGGEEIREHLHTIWTAAQSAHERLFGEKAEVEVLPSARTREPEAVTGTKNVITETERAERQLSPVHRQQYTNIPAAYELGKRVVESGKIDPRILASEIARNPQPLSAEQVGALGYDRARITEEYGNKLQEAGKTDDPDQLGHLRMWMDTLEEAFDLNDQALVKGGREQSAAFNARKMQMKADYSAVAVKQRLKAQNPDKALTEAERTRADNLAASLADVQTKLAAKEEALKTAEADRAVRRITREVEFEARRATRTATIAEIKARRTDIASRLSKKLGRAGAGIPADVYPEVRDLAKTYVEEGVTKVSDLVDKVHTFLSQYIDDLDKRDVRDAISGYGQVAKPTTDPVAIQLQQMKRAMRLISQIEDVQAGDRPLRSGFKPHADAPQVVQLRAELDTALRKAGMREPWSMSPEQRIKGIKTRLEARIADLDRRIKERDFSRGQKMPPPTTPDIEKLRARKDVLQKRYDAMKPPTTPSEAQRLATLKKTTQSRIDELNRRIKEQDFSAKKAAAVKADAELAKLRSQRDALQKRYDALKPPGETRTLSDAARLKGVKTRLNKQIEELQGRIDRGELEAPPKREGVPYDKEAGDLKLKRDALKTEIERMIAARRVPHWTEYITATERMNLLSGFTTLGKLTTAALSRMTLTPIEEITGGFLRQLPIIKRVAALAPIEGRPSLRAEKDAFLSFYGRAMNRPGDLFPELRSVSSAQDFMAKVRTGGGSLEARFGGEYFPAPNKYLRATQIPGQIHGALKSPAQRANFFRALDKLTENALRDPKTRDLLKTDQAFQDALGAQAYLESQRAILMADNTAVQTYRMMLASLSRKGTVGAITARTLLKYELPIVRVPTAFISEAVDYGSMGASGVTKLVVNSLKQGGIDKLTPDQADSIMRALKKGVGVGGALFALGYYQPNGFKGSGFYQRGDKKKGVQDETTLFGVPIPKWATHIPALEAFQIGATLRRANDENKSALEKARRVGVGLAEQIPFYEEPAQAMRGSETESGSKRFLGEQIRQGIVPLGLQQLFPELKDFPFGKIVPKDRSDSGRVQTPEQELRALTRPPKGLIPSGASAKDILGY